MKVKQRSAIDQKPNAWITSPKDKGRKSIKRDNQVYLKDNQNFEIELFNPLKEPVLAEIKVNGKSVSSTGLVLRPGERFYLDCFIDSGKKFVFKTYIVENTEESKEATSINGIVEIFFYKEETLRLNNWREVFIPVIERKYYPVYPWYQPYYNTYYPYLFQGTAGNYTVTNNTLGGNIQNSLGTLGNSVQNYTSTISGACNNTISYSSNNLSDNVSYTSNYFNSSQDIETGRIEKGESSSQKFSEVDMQFERYHINNVIYKLLPESLKPVETKDLTKKYCEDCGNKLSGKERFCPSCGNKLV